MTEAGEHNFRYVWNPTTFVAASFIWNAPDATVTATATNDPDMWDTAELEGHLVNIYGGQTFTWSYLTGPPGASTPTFTSPNGLLTDVIVDEDGLYEFQFQSTNGACGPVVDTVTVTFERPYSPVPLPAWALLMGMCFMIILTMRKVFPIR